LVAKSTIVILLNQLLGYRPKVKSLDLITAFLGFAFGRQRATLGFANEYLVLFLRNRRSQENPIMARFCIENNGGLVEFLASLGGILITGHRNNIPPAAPPKITEIFQKVVLGSTAKCDHLTENSGIHSVSIGILRSAVLLITNLAEV
jgi:hypothetical protein